jgi:hypothetical protein
MGEVRSAYNILDWKPEGTRPLGRRRRRWKDNIKMDLWEIRFGDYGFDSFGTGSGQVASSYEHGDEPSGNLLTS